MGSITMFVVSFGCIAVFQIAAHVRKIWRSRRPITDLGGFEKLLLKECSNEALKVKSIDPGKSYRIHSRSFAGTYDLYEVGRANREERIFLEALGPKGTLAISWDGPRLVQLTLNGKKVYKDPTDSDLASLKAMCGMIRDAVTLHHYKQHGMKVLRGTR